ncbi:MAG: hypothetical protein LBD23_03485 [Oscillospiraceae bacterium]|jgi:hypothetical protein|nr:hypothetical protein [Oscillospiraceae bacterium]
MKKIKTILVILFFCGVSLFACSCKQRTCDVDIEKPGDLKPIDWGEYNDVYTVFWNILKNDCRGSGYQTEDTVKVYGKISDLKYVQHYPGDSTYLHSFVLNDIHEYNDIFIFDHLRTKYGCPAPSVTIFCYHIADKLQKMLDSCDMMKECFIKGELGTIGIGSEGFDKCCFTVPSIYLCSIDDIYFETDKNDSYE